MPTTRPTVPAEVLEAFTAATLTAFEELTRTPLAPGEPDGDWTGPPADWVVAEIALLRTVEGRLWLAFPRPVLETLAGRFLAHEPQPSPDLVEDAAGEFANVIAGQTKTMLQGTPYHFNISTPQIGPWRATPADEDIRLALPFDSDTGRFVVAISLPLAPGMALARC